MKEPARFVLPYLKPSSTQLPTVTRRHLYESSALLTHTCCVLAQGKYYYLPNANDAAIAMAASSAMAEAKAA